MIRTLTTSAFVLAAIALPGVAFAQSTDALPVAVVSYTDLNLSAGSGAASLQHRVKSAISAVCPDTDIRDIEAYTATKRCRANAAAAAAGQVTAAISSSQRMATRETTTRIASR